MIKEKTKREMLDDWLNALRSGEYKQATGALCKDIEGTLHYCCVGVLDEVVFKTTWHLDEDNGICADDSGEEGNLSTDTVSPLGLDAMLTPTEVLRLIDYNVELEISDSRIAALALVNDQGVDFDTIAMLIEEFGWNAEA